MWKLPRGGRQMFFYWSVLRGMCTFWIARPFIKPTGRAKAHSLIDRYIVFFSHCTFDSDRDWRGISLAIHYDSVITIIPMVIGQTCNYWDRIGLECVRRINVENTATQKLWRFQEFVLHINDCCDRNDTQMRCISYWIGRSTNTISTRHSFFCPSALNNNINACLSLGNTTNNERTGPTTECR